LLPDVVKVRIVKFKTNRRLKNKPRKINIF